MHFGILSDISKDNRYKFLHDILLEDNHSVKILDLNNFNNNLLNNIDVLIAPIPFSKDNINIFSNNSFNINITELITKMSENNIKVLVGGLINKHALNLCEKFNIKVIDFFEDEQVAILNAIPTAEGAIQIAMVESPRTIFNSKCLVLGYGRCGKVLANTLKGLGADITATYRKTKDLGYIKAYGLKSLYLPELNNYLKNFDFIFNTIPHMMLTKDNLQYINKDTIIIDLATAPGGVDYNYARELGLNALYCPSLPSRVAPLTASNILKECLYKELI